MRYMLTALLAVTAITGVQAFVSPSRSSASTALQVPTTTTTTTTFMVKPQEEKTLNEAQVTRLLQNYGERSRPYRRDIFTASDWIRSRRPERFVDSLLTTFQSGLIAQISLIMHTHFVL